MVIGGQFLRLESKYDQYTNTGFQAFTETVYSASHFLSEQKIGKYFGAALRT